jgi:hypothetical protein
MFDQYERRFNLRDAIIEDLEFHDFGRFMLAVARCVNFIKPSLVSASIYYPSHYIISHLMLSESQGDIELLDQLLLHSSCALGVILTSPTKPLRNGAISTALSTLYSAAVNLNGSSVIPNQAIRFSTVWFWEKTPTLDEIFR